MNLTNQGVKPISPYELVDYYQNSRWQRKDQIVKDINSFLTRQVRMLITSGALAYHDLPKDEEADLIAEIMDEFRQRGWLIHDEEHWVMFSLPGKMLNNDGKLRFFYDDRRDQTEP